MADRLLRLAADGTEHAESAVTVSGGAADAGKVPALAADGKLDASVLRSVGSAVTSFVGRTGAVVATLNDYAASLVSNDSTVTGATVKAALETLLAALAGKAATTVSVLAGAGMTGGGTIASDRTLNVVATDGSIVVSADSVGVGVISDAQHGTRSGGTTHALAVAGGAAGYISGIEKQSLAALALPSYLTLAADTALANERVLAVGTGVQMDDAGAGGALTFSSTGNGARNNQVGTAYTLVLSDAGKTVQCSHTALITVTIPHTSTVNMPFGTKVFLFQGGTGQINVVGAANVNLLLPPGKAAATGGINTVVRLRHVTTNYWILEHGLLDISPVLTLGASPGYPSGRALAVGTGVQMLDGGAGSALTLSSTHNGAQVIVTAATYTLLLTDAGKSVNFNASAGTTLTIPHTSTVNFPIGTEIFIFQSILPAGQVTIVGAANVSVLVPPGKLAKTAGTHSTVKLRHLDTNAWSISNELADAVPISTLTSPTYLTLSADTALANERVVAVSTGVQMLDGGAGNALTLSSTHNGARNTQSGTAYTLVLGDAGRTVSLNNALPITLTIPPVASVPFPLGTWIWLHSGLAGQVTIAGAGVTLILPPGKSAQTIGAGSMVRIFHLDTNFWVLEGDLVDTTQYLTLAATARYPNERVFTLGPGLQPTDGGAGGALTVSRNILPNALNVTAYTLALTDAWKQVILFNVAGCALTIPANASVPFPLGTEIWVHQTSHGSVSFTIPAGVNFISRNTTTLGPASGLSPMQGKSTTVRLVKTLADEWMLFGEIATNVNVQSGAAYTLAANDPENIVVTTSATAVTVTVPTNATMPYAVGTTIRCLQAGAGLLTIAGGVTLNPSPGKSLRSSGINAVVTCIKRAADIWSVSGDLEDITPPAALGEESDLPGGSSVGSSTYDEYGTSSYAARLDHYHPMATSVSYGLMAPKHVLALEEASAPDPIGAMVATCKPVYGTTTVVDIGWGMTNSGTNSAIELGWSSYILLATASTAAATASTYGNRARVKRGSSAADKWGNITYACRVRCSRVVDTAYFIGLSASVAFPSGYAANACGLEFGVVGAEGSVSFRCRDSINAFAEIVSPAGIYPADLISGVDLRFDLSYGSCKFSWRATNGDLVWKTPVSITSKLPASNVTLVPLIWTMTHTTSYASTYIGSQVVRNNY